MHILFASCCVFWKSLLSRAFRGALCQLLADDHAVISCYVQGFTVVLTCVSESMHKPPVLCHRSPIEPALTFDFDASSSCGRMPSLSTGPARTCVTRCSSQGEKDTVCSSP